VSKRRQFGTKAVREAIKLRRMELAGKPDELVFSTKVKEDLAMLTLAELYAPLEKGKYAGMLAIEALPKLYRDVVFGLTSVSKQQQAAIMRWYDQYAGRGEVARENKEEADANSPKVLYIGAGSKSEPKTIPAEIVPRLEE
jgi:hypothetical protein